MDRATRSSTSKRKREYSPNPEEMNTKKPKSENVCSNRTLEKVSEPDTTFSELRPATTTSAKSCDLKKCRTANLYPSIQQITKLFTKVPSDKKSAACKERTDLIKSLTIEKYSLCYGPKSDQPQTPLSFALLHGHVHYADALLKQKGTPLISSLNPDIYYDLIKQEAYSTLEHCIQKKSEISDTTLTNDLKVCLGFAITLGKEKGFKRLLNLIQSHQATSIYKDSGILHDIIASNQTTLFNLLLDNININDLVANPEITRALSNQAFCNLIVSKIPKDQIDYQYAAWNHQTILQLIIIHSGSLIIIKELINQRADVRIQDDLGKTSLHYAVMHCQEAYKILIEADKVLKPPEYIDAEPDADADADADSISSHEAYVSESEDSFDASQEMEDLDSIDYIDLINIPDTYGAIPLYYSTADFTHHKRNDHVLYNSKTQLQQIISHPEYFENKKHTLLSLAIRNPYYYSADIINMILSNATNMVQSLQEFRDSEGFNIHQLAILAMDHDRIRKSKLIMFLLHTIAHPELLEENIVQGTHIKTPYNLIDQLKQGQIPLLLQNKTKLTKEDSETESQYDKELADEVILLIGIIKQLQTCYFQNDLEENMPFEDFIRTYKSSALHFAVLTKNERYTHELQSLKAPLYYGDIHTYSPYHAAILMENTELYCQLRHDYNYIEQNGLALYLAADKNPEMLEALHSQLKIKMQENSYLAAEDIDDLLKAGIHALSLAIKNRNWIATKRLFACDNKWAFTGNSKNQAGMHLVADLDVESLALFKVVYSPIGSEDLYDNIDRSGILYYAANKGHYNIIKHILCGIISSSSSSSSSVLLHKNNNGNIPLHVAAMQGFPRVVNLLLGTSHKIGLYVTDLDNDTALHAAAQHGHTDVCKILLTADSKKTLHLMKNNDQKTARQLAMEKNHKSVIELIDRFHPPLS